MKNKRRHWNLLINCEKVTAKAIKRNNLRKFYPSIFYYSELMAGVVAIVIIPAIIATASSNLIVVTFKNTNTTVSNVINDVM